jgi:hypothetical protein
MSDPQPVTRRTVEDRIVEQAWKDDAFRKELVKDPRAAIEKFLGAPLPAKVRIKVVEEDADSVVIVLPAPAQQAPAGKLSAAELEEVAGGWDMETSYSCEEHATMHCNSCLSCYTTAPCYC